MKRHINLLGTLYVEDDGKPSAILRSPLGCALLTYLLVTRRAQRREVIADLLWDASSTTESLRNLRQMLHRLRPLLPELQITHDELASDVTNYVSVDLHVLEAGLSAPNATQLDAALRHYTGELLSGFNLENATVFNEWLGVERERLRQQVWSAYRQVCATYREQKAWARGIDTARRWLALDDLDEEPRRHLMQFLMADGQLSAAREQFELCRRHLWEALGVEPESETLDLYRRIGASSGSEPVMGQIRDWGEAPDVPALFDREAELEQLSHWFTSEGAHLIAVLGMGGQGKTALATRATHAHTDHFDTIFWRSLLNAPPIEIVLAEYVNFLNRQQTPIPDSIPAQLAEVRQHVQSQRHLLILDNLDTILDPNDAGQFRRGYEGYEQLLQLFAIGGHQGTLLITSREALLLTDRWQKQFKHMFVMPLGGLTAEAGNRILAEENIHASCASATALTRHYSGNPLALQLAAQTIAEFYGGDVDAFLADESLMFEDIRILLGQQFDRLTPSEQEVMTWLAIAREAKDPATLADDMLQKISRRQLLDVIKKLHRRSLLVREGVGYTLQNVIMEYLTDRLIDVAVQELTRGTLDALHRYPLMQVRVKEYVRQSQLRLILHPVAHQLENQFSRQGLTAQLQQILHRLRHSHANTVSYAGGTILNLLLALDVNLTGFDFSRLHIRQADLRSHNLTRVDLRMAHLNDCAFTQPFGRIESVAIHPDGRHVAGAGDDGEIRVYRTFDGQPTNALVGHKNTVKTLAFSADGALLVSVSQDGTARVWDAQEWKVYAELDAKHSLSHAALSAHGDYVACAGASQSVLLWAFRSGDLFRSPPLHAARVSAVAFDATGRLLASADLMGCIHMWQIQRPCAVAGEACEPLRQSAGACLQSPKHAPVLSLAFSPDGSMLASGTENGTIDLWDSASGRRITTLKGHTKSVYSLQFAAENSLLFSCGDDHTVRVWDVASRRTVNLLQGGHTIWSLSLSADGLSLATCGEDGTICLWQMATPEQITLTHTLRGYRKSIDQVHWSPDGRLLATADAHGIVRLWEVAPAGLNPIKIFDGFVGHPDISFGSDGNWLIITSEERAGIWHLQAQRWVSALPELKMQRSSVFVTDRHLLITSDASGAVHAWDMTNPSYPRHMVDLPGYRERVRVFCAPNNRAFAVLDRSVPSTVHVYSTETLRRIAQLWPNNLASFVAFDPSGEQIVVEGPEFSICLWNIADSSAPSLVCSFVGHTDEVLDADFSADGTLLVSGGIDQTIRLWDVATGEEIALLGSHPQYVQAVAFSPDGKWIVSAGKEGTLRIWDVALRQCRHVVYPPGPYEGMDITAVTGITEAERAGLKSLGAVEASR